MRSLTNTVLAALALVTLVAGCAADPSGAEEAEAAPVAAEAEENVAQVEQPMKWTKPMCAYFRWVCGACICDACNVVDCRNATTATATMSAAE